MYPELKIKLKTLAFEARAIRREETFLYGRKALAHGDRLYLHRVNVVRRVARHTHLAYGFLRGRAYRQLEAKCEIPPSVKEIARMVGKYGPEGRNETPEAAVERWLLTQ